MKVLRQSRLLVPLLLIGFALLLIAGFGVLYQSAPPAVLDTMVNETTIHFSASRASVLFPHACVTLTWDVFNTNGVFINEELLPAQGQQALCVDSDIQPIIRVILLNDAGEKTYTLNITILVYHPLFVMGAAITLALMGTGTGLLILRLSGDMGRMKAVQTMTRVALTTLFGILIAAFLLEILLRFYFTNFGTRDQKIMYLYSLEEIRALQTSVLPMPYISYVPSPEHAQDGNNRLGYRGPEVAIPKPAGVFRIVAMGGSTTYSTGTTADESYPALLQKILREEYGYTNVEVINAGVIGYTSWEILAAFEFRVLELEPDMLILYEAVNDLVVRERSTIDCYRGLNALRGLNPWRGLFIERNAPYPPSTLYRVLAVTSGWLPNPLALDSSFEPVKIDCAPDPPETTLEQRLAQNPPVYFERNVRNLMALALANHVQPVISSWAYDVNAGRPQLWQDNIALHNRITRQIAAEMQIPYIDLAVHFPVNPAFWEPDGIHLVAAGTAEQAHRYAAFLVENGLIPES